MPNCIYCGTSRSSGGGHCSISPTKNHVVIASGHCSYCGTSRSSGGGSCSISPTKNHVVGGY